MPDEVEFVIPENLDRIVRRAAWAESLRLSLSEAIPDEFPEGYAQFLVDNLLEEGAFEEFEAGLFPSDTIFDPTIHAIAFADRQKKEK